MLEDAMGAADATGTGVTRREFLGTSLAAGAAVALGAALPAAAESTVMQAQAGTAVGQTLATIAEIAKTTKDGPVQGVIKVLSENKTYLGASKAAPGATAAQSGQMRYFTGSLPGGPEIWPPKNGSPAPGPTIRARVGDTVQITLLNQVDVAAFGDSLDAGETTGSCDVATTVGPTGAVNTYPGSPPFDTMPNCFHGSSTVNMHYHGTHISPTILGDNVFAQLRPSPRANGRPVVDEAYLRANNFDRIFTNCQAGHPPQTWNDLPERWRRRQQNLLTQYDKSAVWQGKRGLPPDEQLWPKDAADIRAGRWPQFFVGAYPSCFQLPAWNGQPTSMGQSPGTHWYHAHKHGSSALNLANGMAGAFIVEGDYDDKLEPFYNKEVVLVLQQYAAQVNLARAPGANTAALVFVNGQYTPVVEMQPNEVQFWRIINACHSAAVPINGPTGVKWVQTAQDGVQLDPRNYGLALKAAQNTPGTWTNATLTTPMTAPPWFGNLAPGNRVDMLVQAPAAAGSVPGHVWWRHPALHDQRHQDGGRQASRFPAAAECLPGDARVPGRHRPGCCRRSTRSALRDDADFRPPPERPPGAHDQREEVRRPHHRSVHASRRDGRMDDLQRQRRGCAGAAAPVSYPHQSVPGHRDPEPGRESDPGKTANALDLVG